ncbi:hypothetical protein LSTR_LSTR007644 [Laodelphax striatellus]|uniref:BRCT domain-containing protein n=1 Tax=Laodelphax striatellus TaxID=195883 RepID=A0A482WIC1_LAOST|nr:hypothetical protein LSTR_LSTR007644 [Laodelphax striatellus]
MNLWVVNFDWVLKSLENNKVQPEELFLTLYTVGEPGPRRCKFEDNLPLSNYFCSQAALWCYQ